MMKRYQSAYLKATTQKQKGVVMTNAQLNLSPSEFNEFVKWQVGQMNAEDSQHGGRRTNSGRKPVEDKKVTVSIYPQQSRVELLGIAAIKDISITAIEKEYKKQLKSKH